MPLVADTTVSFASPADFAKQVYAAFLALGLSKGAAQLLTAHTAVSTGWGRGAGNYRLAGIKACGGSTALCDGTSDGSSSCTVNYTCNQTSEYKDGVRIRVKAPFRSYDSLSAGAQGILNVLAADRYAKSRAYLEKGDTRYFAQVGAAGWYTAPIAKVEADALQALELVWKYTGGKYTITTTSPFLFVVLIVGGYYLYRKFRRR